MKTPLGTALIPVFGAVLLVMPGPAAMAAVDPGAAVIPRMEYEPLPPGSYRLERIQAAPDALLLDANGRLSHLRQATHGRVTLLTFFYTYCVDPLGCPYAYAVMAELRDKILNDPHLASGARFVSVSLDPGNDTPAAIRAYGASMSDDKRLDWRFFTARSVPELLPLLEDLGQDVSIDTDAQGRARRTLHHMLKMFLIDRAGMVREIYTLAYLQPRVILNDIKTLLMESRSIRHPDAGEAASTMPPSRTGAPRANRSMANGASLGSMLPLRMDSASNSPTAGALAKP